MLGFWRKWVCKLQKQRDNEDRGRPGSQQAFDVCLWNAVISEKQINKPMKEDTSIEPCLNLVMNECHFFPFAVNIYDICNLILIVCVCVLKQNPITQASTKLNVLLL